MTFKTLLLAGASVTLLGACSSPFEYNTYESDGARTYKSTDHSMDKKDEGAPMDIKNHAGRVD